MSEFKLNKAQQEAVDYVRGSLLIIAGAGTGKTAVITRKIVHLIESGSAKPEEILALTFTDKAAAEMEDRVDTLLSESDKVVGLAYADIHISTFHAFCQRFLENHAIDIGLSNTFKLLTETESWLLIREHLYDLKLNYYRPLGNPTKHIHELLKHFSKCKDELISPQDYLDYVENERLDQDRHEIEEKDRLLEIANLYHHYNQLLINNNKLDFGDLIFYSVKLLRERNKIKQSLQSRFKYILVDEFQDVNYAQYELVKLLSENGILTVVGDDDQSIYAFRGASVSNIMRFKDDYPQAKEVVLNENFRSVQEILDIAYKSIRHNNPDRLECKLKIDKKLISKFAGDKEDQFRIQYLHSQTVEEEAKMIAEKICELKEKKHCDWNDFVILMRANSQAEPFMTALEAIGIPYEYIASSGLYRQPIVMDSINYFKLIDNYHESGAVYRLLKMPFFNTTENDLQKITAMAKKKSISYYEALKRAREFGLSEFGIEICNKLIALIHSGMRQARDNKPTRVLYDFLELSGYLKYLIKEEERGNAKVIRQIYQIKQFFDFLDKYEHVTPDPNIAGFVSYYMNLVESGDEGSMYKPDDTPESVNIMTIHASKGLEYKYVFIVNMVHDRFPSRRKTEAIEIPSKLIKEQLSEGDVHMQEERRLFYVAMTRAKERLFFSGADYYNGLRKKKPSIFLGEVDISSGSQEKNKTNLMSSISVPPRLYKHEEKTEFAYQLPKAFSFSQIKSYENCPFQYKLNHILKIQTKGNASFSFGKSMHATMQKFYKQVQELNSAKQESLFDLPIESNSCDEIKAPHLDDLLKIYNDCWIDDWYKSKNQRESYFKKGKEILVKFYKNNENNWTVPIALESWFKIKIGDHIIHGSIDRVDYADDEGLEIIDYKTGKSKEKLSADDKSQLLIYQIAAEALPQYKNIAPVAKLTFYFLNDNLVQTFVGNDKDKEKLKNKIISVIDKIISGDYTATPEKFKCAHCDFKDICQFRVV